MFALFIAVSILATIPLGKYVFEKWFNPITFYAVPWAVMILTYQLKLINYPDLKVDTWIIIFLTYWCFILGILSFYISHKNPDSRNNLFCKEAFRVKLFEDDGKFLKYLIFVFSTLGLIGGIQYWSVLLHDYGSFENILLNAGKIYRERVQGEIHGVVPYIYLFSYLGVFFSALYTAYKQKFSILILYPILAVIVRELANFSRAGILYGFLEFVLTFILFRHLLKKNSKIQVIRPSKKMIFSVIIAVLIMIIGASLIKTLRNPEDVIQNGGSRALNKFEGGFFISPSVYLYLSSHIVVFDKYMHHNEKSEGFGANTFFTAYSILSKFDFVNKPKYYHRGYYIPVWSNTSTYLHDLFADFGYSGLYLFPFLLGFLSSWFWYLTYQKNSIIYLTVLVHLSIVIGFSFFVIATRFPNWSLGLVFILLIIPLIEKITTSKSSG